MIQRVKGEKLAKVKREPNKRSHSHVTNGRNDSLGSDNSNQIDYIEFHLNKTFDKKDGGPWSDLKGVRMSHVGQGGISKHNVSKFNSFITERSSIPRFTRHNRSSYV